MQELHLVWFRRDLRLEDNQALASAVRSGKTILPVFIWAPEEESWPPGAASKVWLHYSLSSLESQLAELGSTLILKKGSSLETILSLRKRLKDLDYQLSTVHCSKIYEPKILESDERMSDAFQKEGIDFCSYGGSLLFDPFQVKTAEGKAYQVFTPFWKTCSAGPMNFRGGQPKPQKLNALCADAVQAINSLKLDSLELLPRISWQSGILSAWQPGSVAAKEMLDEFLQDAVNSYAIDRDYPAKRGTSRLSPYLHFGEISVHSIWLRVNALVQAEQQNKKILPGQKKESLSSAAVYLKELGWREFAHHVLCNFPHTDRQPLRSDFAGFPWQVSENNLKAWQEGKTGYPIVDAGMRELWHCGWMHNRVRMIVASFLVKDLLISWQQGADWFWDTLVDADLANNTLGWQWSGGCGADAAPYFRVFNPLLQGQKFDPNGTYVRSWLPELQNLPSKFVHAPWTAPAAVLKEANLELGKDYPLPIVDHDFARKRALEAFSSIRKQLI